jgi:multiple sugar transport system permease protein
VPHVWQTQNFGNVIKAVDFVRLYANTIAMIALRILCAIVTATLSGYAFARLEFKGKNLMFAIVLVQMMVPVQIFIIPQYVMVSKLHMTNSIMGLVFPGVVSAFGTFLMRQAFKQLPRDLEEAARLDGCSIPQTFLFIMSPLTRSSMVALGIFTAVFAYKDLMWPMIVCPDNRATTLASALAKMNAQYQQKYPELMMAALISCVPMIVIYVLFQRQFIEGIATSGGKL